MKYWKKYLSLSLLILGVMGLSGCSSADLDLVSPEQAIVEVGERNKEVLESLKKQGSLSDVKANYYMDIINANVDRYKAALTSPTENLDDINKILKSIVNVIGEDNDKGYYGINYTTCSVCDSHQTTGSNSKFEPDGVAAKWHGSNFAGADLSRKSELIDVKTEQDGKTIGALEFIDGNLVDGLCKDMNKKIWVLNPDKVKTKEQLINLIDRLQAIKAESSTGSIPYEKFKSLYSNYFMPTDATLFDYTAETLLEETTDNHTALGKENSGNSSLNKDVVISGTLSGVLHKVKKDDQGNEFCEKEGNITKNVGVYTLRVKEFDTDLIEELKKGNFTDNKYILVDGQTANEVSTAVLMEYPVAVIDKLVVDSEGSNKWHFDWAESDMRVNIFNGEILYRQEDGSYAVINKEDDKESKIYRVTGENAAKSTNVGKNISFTPNGSTTLGLESLITLTDYKVKLMSRLDNGSDYGEDNIGIKLNTWYPSEVETKVGLEFTKLGDTYSFHIDGDSNNKLDTTLEKLNNTGSYLEQMHKLVYDNNKDWNKIWEYYEKVAAEINSTHGTTYSESRNDWYLYKLYDALKTAGHDLDNSQISEWFTNVDVYNSLKATFTYDDGDSCYLTEDYFTEYDKAWVVGSIEVDDFEYERSSNTDTFSWYKDSALMSEDGSGKLKIVKEAVDSLSDNGLKAYYNLICSEGKMFNTRPLYKFVASASNDANIGKEVDVVSENLKLNPDTRVYEYKYAGKWYRCSDPVPKNPNPETNSGAIAKDVRDVTTVRFALTDYLELTYMPDVIDSEDFIATGRRISITDIKGEGDQVIGFFANKVGDRIQQGNTDIKVSDIISYDSGQQTYYDGIAKILSAVQTNSNEVEDELKKSESDRVEYLKTIIDPNSNTDTTGMVGDKMLLRYKLGLSEVTPILKFTSSESNTRPSLDVMDIDNDAIKSNVYYGICVNTHAYNSGLYTNWIDVNSDGGDDGSLRWWNSWLASHGYNYQIDISKLKYKMSGVYAVSLAQIDDTIVFDADTLKVINKEMNSDKEVEAKSLINTLTTLLGGFLLVYGLILMGFWVLDVNMINGPGFLTIATFGKFVAITDSSDVPLMPGNGKIYVDFKALFMATIVFMIVGMLLVLFDLQVFWEQIPKMFESIVDAFSDLLLNK